MKKLMIAAAIVCAATFANAAAVGWNCVCGSNWKNGDYSVFVVGINGFTGIDQIKATIAAGGLDAVDSYAWAKGYTTNGSGSASVSASDSAESITWGGTGSEVYTALIVVQNADGDEASYTATKTITMADNSTSKTFQFSSQASNLTANKFEVVPEPTTGLLMLFGMGALALRRRRT